MTGVSKNLWFYFIFLKINLVVLREKEKKRKSVCAFTVVG